MKKIISKIMLCLLVIPCVLVLAGCKANSLSEEEKVQAFDSLKEIISTRVENFKNPTSTYAVEGAHYAIIKVTKLDFNKSGLTKEQQDELLSQKDTLEELSTEESYYYGVKVNEDQTKVGYVVRETKTEEGKEQNKERFNNGFESQFNKLDEVNFIQVANNCKTYNDLKNEFVKSYDISVEDFDNISTQTSFTKNKNVYTFKVEIKCSGDQGSANYVLIGKFTNQELISCEINSEIIVKGEVPSNSYDFEGCEDLPDDKVVEFELKVVQRSIIYGGKEFNNEFIN